MKFTIRNRYDDSVMFEIEADSFVRAIEAKKADLREADLRGADLCGADLRGANLDFSCWPLWCGSFGVKIDLKIAAQLAYHFCRVDCQEPEYQAARTALMPLANKFHRAEECGEIK
jgi:hypothetical protein